MNWRTLQKQKKTFDKTHVQIIVENAHFTDGRSVGKKKVFKYRKINTTQIEPFFCFHWCIMYVKFMAFVCVYFFQFRLGFVGG